MEDQRHLKVIDDIARELLTIVADHNGMANGVTDKADLIAILRNELDALAESIRKNRRVLDFMEGKPIEPEQHYAEAVLTGVGAGGGWLG